MKKTMKRWMAFVLFLSIMFGATTTALAAEPEKKEKVVVYDGAGQYIGEFDSITDFQREYSGIKQRSAVKWIVKIVRAALEAYEIVEINEEFTGIDINGWIDKNITLPISQGLGTFRLYSISGGITNPYPPNSYQYSQFNKTNYYWVKE